MKVKCPLCGSDRCGVIGGEGFVSVRCEAYRVGLGISGDIMDAPAAEQSRMLNLIAERVTASPQSPVGGNWSFYLGGDGQALPQASTGVNLSRLLSDYPHSFMDKSNRILLNLCNRHPNYGAVFSVVGAEHRLYFPEFDGGVNQSQGAVQILTDLGYLRRAQHDDFYISAEGWKRAEELRRRQAEARQGFIAMSFNQHTLGIREAFRKAISLSGYIPVIIDEKEHNNQIVPEILYEIRRSRFIVVDVSYPNFGAYYEAGYAQGLGKEVIACCRKDVFDSSADSPHFDIAQKSLVIWADEGELVKKLARRIEATVV